MYIALVSMPNVTSCQNARRGISSTRKDNDAASSTRFICHDDRPQVGQNGGRFYVYQPHERLAR